MARESEKWLDEFQKRGHKHVRGILSETTHPDEKKVIKAKNKWGFKTKIQNIELPKYDVESLLVLNCGCSCLDCRKNFTAYWEEKAVTQEMQISLEQEKIATKEILDEVGLLEKDLMSQIKELKMTLEAERGRCRRLEEEITTERKLRMDDVYRRERQDEETKAVRIEQRKTESHLISFQEEVDVSRKDISALKRANESLSTTKERLLRQMQEYESMLATLERSNGDLRTKTYQLDIENAKLKGRNERLKSELEKASEHLKSFTTLKRTSLARSSLSAPHPQSQLLLQNASQSSLSFSPIPLSSLQMQLAPLRNQTQPKRRDQNFISRESSVFSSQTLSSARR